MNSSRPWETEPRLWPKAGCEYVFLAEAFHKVGKALFPEAWTGGEAGPRVGPLVEAPFALEARMIRRDAAAGWIAERARNDDLVTWGLWHRGGVAPELLGPSVWNVPDDWSLFMTCTVMRPHYGGLAPYYLFVTRQSLEHCLAKARGPQVSMANAQAQAEAWLCERFADPTWDNMLLKVEFERTALELFYGLSRRAFQRAWDKAVADHPERSKPGPKSTQTRP